MIPQDAFNNPESQYDTIFLLNDSEYENIGPDANSTLRKEGHKLKMSIKKTYFCMVIGKSEKEDECTIKTPMIDLDVSLYKMQGYHIEIMII